MNYHIHITLTAEKDMIHVVDYIEYVLKNPLVDDKILSSWGVCFVTVGNYLAFYTISEEEKQVNIVRFLYAKSDWHSILKLDFPLI